MANVSDIQDELRDLQKDVSRLGSHAADLADTVRKVGKGAVDSAFCKSKKAVEQASKSIKKNPGVALAGALGLGVILGKIVKGLRRR